ncbi:MAG: hypothetical protein JJ953_14575 [Gracilimonas sp.]|uniref:hypothetical protein n=1 Tax=Gracilimonas TaxID=649462 RepID=UPI001B1DB914|nr:hypothetical protein [Gracilimonas sp.]MBO6587333.1 hypothetical protein [Gracilimonas sp.]
MLKIDDYNFDVLSERELIKVKGGNPIVGWGALIWFGNQVVSNWEDIKRGAIDAWNEISY